MTIRQTGFHAVLGLATATILAFVTPAQAVTEIQWWHAMTGGNDIVNKLAEDFNSSQTDYKVVPSFKGSYPDTMNAGIARFAVTRRISFKVFEVGTATMMSAKGRDQAGLRIDEGRGRAVRPQGLSACDHGLLLDGEGRHAVVSLQFLVDGDVDQPRRAEEGEHRGDTENMAGGFDAAKKLKAAGHTTCGFSNAWASAGPISNSSPHGITCRSAARRTASTASTPCWSSTRRCTSSICRT